MPFINVKMVEGRTSEQKNSWWRPSHSRWSIFATPPQNRPWSPLKILPKTTGPKVGWCWQIDRRPKSQTNPLHLRPILFSEGVPLWRRNPFGLLILDIRTSAIEYLMVPFRSHFSLNNSLRSFRYISPHSISYLYWKPQSVLLKWNGDFYQWRKGKWRPRSINILWYNYLFIVRIFYGAISSLQWEGRKTFWRRISWNWINV